MYGGIGVSIKVLGFFLLLDWWWVLGENFELMVRYRCDVNVLDEKSFIRSWMGEEWVVSGRNFELMVVECDSYVYDL